MKNKLVLLLLLVSCLLCCTEQESSISSESGRFFDASGAEHRLSRIVDKLKQKNDSVNFVSDFVEAYGYPLWKEAILFPAEGYEVYAVPVRSELLGAEIESIWFFFVGEEITTYRILTRRAMTRAVDDYVEQNWMFDYFTTYALRKKPSSGLVIAPEKPLASTRAAYSLVIRYCNHIVAYAGREVYDHGEYCWDKVETFFMGDDTSFDVFSPGGGGTSAAGNGLMDNDYYGGGGGGGGSDSGNSTEQQQEDRSPCGAAGQLSRDAAFRSKVNSLFEEVMNFRLGDTENGWIKTSTGEYIYPAEKTEKSIKYSASSLAGKKITEEYHSHPQGSCIPSFSDLVVLATRWKNGQIDVGNFSYGIVSDMGCLSMVITSESAFGVFMDRVLNDPALKENFGAMHQKPNVNGVQTAIAKFIDFLNKSVSGLNVLFNTTLYDSSGKAKLSDDWQAKNSNGSATLSNYNCN